MIGQQSQKALITVWQKTTNALVQFGACSLFLLLFLFLSLSLSLSLSLCVYGLQLEESTI